MKNHLRSFVTIAFEIALIVIVVISAVAIGSARLQGWNGPAGSLTNDLFVPAIMINAGRGFSNVEPNTLPELRAFLDFRVQDFDLKLIEDSVEQIPLHPFQEFHRYLIYTVAVAWRLFGVNWDAIKALILVYYCLTLLLVYGLCRLAVGSVLSFGVALAFAHSQPVLWTLPVLRDFAKAPFILAIMLLLAATVRFKLRPVYFFVIAGAIGMLLGIGMGFRRDMMVFVPAAVFFIMVAQVSDKSLLFMGRLGAAALLIAFYIMFGWPVHQALQRDGYVAAHDTIMGFASFSDHELGVIEPASYEKHYLLNDLFCTLKAHDAARRGVTFPPEVYPVRCNEPEFDLEMKRAYVLSIVKTFPADMLTRAYAAVLRIATAIIPSPYPFLRFIENKGLIFILISLLIVAGKYPFKAWLILGLLCYFCGYISIQFAIRHAFHMTFVPYFFAAFALQQVLLTVASFLPKHLHAIMPVGKRPHIKQCGKSLFLSSAWLLITLLLFYAPLAAAQAWQRRNVEIMRLSYASAKKTPVPHRVLIWNDRHVFIPTEGRSCRLCQTMGLIVDIETRHLAASFKAVDQPLDILLVYEWEGNSWDFSAPTTFGLAHFNTPADMEYYFPVHETTTCSDWNHFVGISLPAEQAHYFNEFYQVSELDSLGLLVNMIIPENEDQFIYGQYLDIPWTSRPWFSYSVYQEFHPFLRELEIRGLLAENEVAQAAAKAADALQVRPQSIQFTFLLAEALEKQGYSQEAYNVCMSLLEYYPDTFVLFARLDKYFFERGGHARRRDEWSKLLMHSPQFACARFYLDDANRHLGVFDISQ